MKQKGRSQAPIPGSDALYTVPETSSTLKIGNTKTWELISSGALEAVRLGSRCTRIRKSSIDRLIAQGVQQVARAA